MSSQYVHTFIHVDVIHYERDVTRGTDDAHQLDEAYRYLQMTPAQACDPQFLVNWYSCTTKQ